MKIYIAGPFFNEFERDNLNFMIEYVKKAHPNDEIFIPMEHFVKDGESLPNNVWGKEVFYMDLKALENADCVYALYLGHYSDTGTAWELGYAYAKAIPVYLWVPGSVSKVSVMPMNAANVILGNTLIEQK